MVPLTWMCPIRFESTTGALGEEGPRTSEHLFRREFDSLSFPTSVTTSLFSPVEQQSTGVSGITLYCIPQRIAVLRELSKQ